MTNEELVSLIQAGDVALMAELWEQNLGFITLMAKNVMFASPGGGVELNDLTQEAYFGLYDAAMKYDPYRGAKFITHLIPYLKTAFANITSYRTQRRPMLDKAVSLNAPPLGEDNADLSLMDVLPDPENCYDPVEDALVNEQLHTVLDSALSTLKPTEADALRKIYFDGLDAIVVAADEGVTSQTISLRHLHGLERLRKNPRVLRELSQFVDDSVDLYHHVGVGSFARHGSPVELAAEKRERADQRFIKRWTRENAHLLDELLA